jgi:hypothetical protein
MLSMTIVMCELRGANGTPCLAEGLVGAGLAALAA